ncbi:hypothetical protein [Salmonirosea aquatica]|uniref:hypothetical protein n=1 Tax=Salmonirosea aquatica TaxID=2654236 RepID=UPI0035715407
MHSRCKPEEIVSQRETVPITNRDVQKQIIIGVISICLAKAHAPKAAGWVV